MKKLFSIVFISSVIISCAVPQEVTRLSPEAPEGHIEMGREYILLKSDSIQVELGFDGIYDELLVFDLVVYNNTDHPLTLDPSEFYYEILDSANSDTSGFPPKMAVLPEKILAKYNKALEYNEIEKGINAFFGIMETGITFISNASAFVRTDDPGYIVDAIFGTAGSAHHYVVRDRRITDVMEQVTLEKEVVEEEILRMDRVPPGKVVSGFIFFPPHSTPDYLMFCFPVKDQLFQFVYRQHTENLSL